MRTIVFYVGADRPRVRQEGDRRLGYLGEVLAPCRLSAREFWESYQELVGLGEWHRSWRR